MKRILIIEDDKKLARVLELQLSYEGYRLDIAKDGFEGLIKFRENDYDLVLLDVMIPKIDGYEVCKRIKGESDVPIIMVTAKDDIGDRIIGLDTGADDYVVKPFNYGELTARIRAALRRRGNSKNEKITHKDLTLNSENRSVMREEDEIELSKQEFDLLELLMINKGIVVSRDKILAKIWGDEDYLNPNVLDVYIKYLRDKVDRNYEEKYIKTVRGVGYMIK